jgi:hypothetical protein
MDEILLMDDRTDYPAPEQIPDLQASINVLTASITALQTENRELRAS